VREKEIEIKKEKKRGKGQGEILMKDHGHPARYYFIS